MNASISSPNILQIQVVSYEQFLNDMTSKVLEAISSKKDHENDESYLSEKEARKLFNPAPSRVTFHSWTEKGYLTAYYIGGKKLYKYKEIIQAAKSLKKYQRKEIITA